MMLILNAAAARIRLASLSLEEFGLFSSDLTQIVHVDLPALRRLYIQADFKTLVIRQEGMLLCFSIQ